MFLFFLAQCTVGHGGLFGEHTATSRGEARRAGRGERRPLCQAPQAGRRHGACRDAPQVRAVSVASPQLHIRPYFQRHSECDSMKTSVSDRLTLFFTRRDYGQLQTPKQVLDLWTRRRRKPPPKYCSVSSVRPSITRTLFLSAAKTDDNGLPMFPPGI